MRLAMTILGNLHGATGAAVKSHGARCIGARHAALCSLPGLGTGVAMILARSNGAHRMSTVVDLAARNAQRSTWPFCRPHTVRLGDDAERDYWCRRLNATAEHLRNVIREVGSNPAIVQMHLFRR
jgi:hypothetical protein